MSYSRVQPHLMIVIHSLAGGGAERVAADLSAYWVLRGYRLTVVTQEAEDTDVYTLHPNVRRFVLGTAGQSGGPVTAAWSNLRRIWRLRRLIRREHPTIVLGMMTTSSVLAIIAARGLNCRVLATEHTHPPAQKLPQVWQRLRRWAYPKATAVVTLTSGTSSWLERHVPGSRLTVIPNAVSWPLQRVDPIIEPPPRQGRYRLLAVGRLHELKGFDVLLRAFHEISGHFSDWDLVILGEGSLRDELQQQIDELGLSGRISMPGRAGNVADWYLQSDLYVLSSRFEGLSNTLIEAMASGLAPVSFDCETGPREIIRHGIDGVLVSPAGDSEALAAHLSDMMAHPEQREAYARRAVDVRDRFSATRVMAMWGQLFERR